MTKTSVKVLALIVCLSGFVTTSVQRDHAGEIASDVEGVKSVENNFLVKD